MSLPIVAIVGRPNVGKSSLLNMLAGRRISIVDPTPGVTRDRVSAIAEIDDKYFELIDTGGYGIEDTDDLTAHVEQQIQYAIAGASLILFVVDVREEVTPLDQKVAELLRGRGTRWRCSQSSGTSAMGGKSVALPPVGNRCHSGLEGAADAATPSAETSAATERHRLLAGSARTQAGATRATAEGGCATLVLLVANKADVEQHEHQAGGLVSLGFGEPMCVSALHGRHRRELMERIIALIGDAAGSDAPEPVMKLALVGRRNVGKSTFINALVGQERMIVSEIPGTTRDSVDVRFEKDGRAFVAIDTAGVRKTRKQKGDIEFYGYTRALASIRRADVVLLLIDATSPIGEVDKKLAHTIVSECKPCVIVVNKWDLAKGKAGAEDYGEYLARSIPHMDYAPLAFTTAKDGRNIHSTIELAQSLFKQSSCRVTTGQLNRAVEAVLAEKQPMAGRHGAEPKIYYATQVAVRPPTLLLFVNHPALVREPYRRFVEKRLKDTLPFPEIPIRLIWRERQSQGGKPRGPRAADSQDDVVAVE
jgi:GTP-binding protein